MSYRGSVSEREALIAAIERSPDDIEGYAAYGAWLREQGDVRGHLIDAQCEGRSGRELLAQHGAELWGTAAAYARATTPHGSPRARLTAWHWGFLETLWLYDQIDYEERTYGRGIGTYDTVVALDALLACPSARFVRELAIGTLAFDDLYTRVAEVIARRAPRTLRKLTLGDSDADDGNVSTISDLGALSVLGHLDTLVLVADVIRPGRGRPPALRELDVTTDISRHSSLPELCVASWPGVAKLRLELGRNTLTAFSLSPVLHGAAFPDVVELTLGLTSSPELCEAVATSPLAARLETLDLSGTLLADDDARSLSRGGFARLRTLDVSNNSLTEDGVALLRSVFREVRAAGQAP